jgi:hypothetical protein
MLVTESKVLLPDLATGLRTGIFGVSHNSLLEMEDESGVGIVFRVISCQMALLYLRAGCFVCRVLITWLCLASSGRLGVVMKRVQFLSSIVHTTTRFRLL